MSQKDSDLFKKMLTSVLKPIEHSISEIYKKLDSLSSDISEIKSVIFANSNESSSSKVVKNCKPTAPAQPVPITTNNTSTPTSRPAPTLPPTRAQRSTAVRTKERLASQAKQSVRAKCRDKPPKDDLPQTMVDDKINMTADNCANSLTVIDSLTEPIDSELEDLEPSIIPNKTTENVWETAQSRHSRRKSRKPAVIIKGTATDTSLKGIIVHRYLHGCYFKNDTTPESVINHLKSIHDGVQYTVEKIPSKRDSYNSFKIGIPTGVYDKFLSTSVWPINTNISEWQPFLRRRETMSPADNPAPKQNK